MNYILRTALVAVVLFGVVFTAGCGTSQTPALQPTIFFAPATNTATPNPTPTTEATPTLVSTLTPTATPRPTATPTPKPIGPLQVAANPTKGFHWPYFLYAPSSIRSKQILVIPNNTGRRGNDFSVHVALTEGTVRGSMKWASALETALLVPVFPRWEDETDGTIAPQYLTRGTLEASLQKQYPELGLADLQLIAMIDDARERLAAAGIDMESKILLWGYSASGMFASRFTALHPERVKATAFGGHGWAIAPVMEWDGVFLPYPYGVGDLEQLTARPFNLNAFKSVPMYIYLGANDTNSWALPWYIGGTDRRGFYNNFFAPKFGTTASSLLASAKKVYDTIGCSAIFVLYPEATHQITPQMDIDVIKFFQSHQDRK